MDYWLQLLLLTFSLGAYCHYQIFLNGPKPKQVPWAPSRGHGLLAAMHSSVACLWNMSKTLEMAQEMIETSKLPIAISTLLDGPIVILPMSLQQWYSDQEGTAISFLAMMQSRFQYDYTLPDVSIDYSRQLAKVLFRRTKSTIPMVWDEVQQLKLPDSVGYENWRVYLRVLDAFVRITNRMLVGEELCRDQEYIWSLTTWIYFVVPLALLLRCLPGFLRHPVGLVFRQILRFTLHRRLERKLIPLTTRVAASEASKEDNFISWFASEASRSSDPEIQRTTEPNVLATVIINLNFASLHSSIETTNVLFDILSYEKPCELIAELREEIEAVIATLSKEESLTWTHLEQLKLLDSVIKESLRLHPVELATNPRMVTQTLVTPDGVILEPGTKTCLLNSMGNQNESVYPNPSEFDPYRFIDKDSPQQSEASYTISTNYLSFGYGKRACPGRWFATATMKMVLARLLVEREFLGIEERPRSWYVGMMPIPDPLGEVGMKRRVEEE